MKLLKRIFLPVTAALLMVSCAKQIECSVPAKMVDGTIVTETPNRAPGQQTALQLTCPALDTVRVAFVGIGHRGTSAVKRWAHLDGVKIIALCDLYQERIDICQKVLEDAGLPKAAEYVGEKAYEDLCKRDDINLVYIATSWDYHVPVGLCAMENGKHTAIEVPTAMTLKDCWDLVDACERTQLHCMCLENCCYDFFEMAALQMAQKGLFGEVCHVEGAYIHELASNLGPDHEPWRMGYNSEWRGDNYPTHGFGPIAQVLNLHRGDKMNTLVAMDTKSFNGAKYGKQNYGYETFADGDHTISLIRTDAEKLIEIQHNIYSPRPYSRMYQITGTEGFANKYPIYQLAFVSEQSGHGHVTPTAEEKMNGMLQEYLPDFAKEIQEEAKKVGGHGGMDYIMDYRLVYCLRNGLPLDMDVYDMAEWCCVQELSRISMENGSVPVQVPDFTRGDWNKVEGFSYALK